MISTALLTRDDMPHAPRARERCRYCVRVGIADVVVELRSDDDTVARAFAERYDDHIVSREPDFEYYVATEAHGYLFWCAHAGGYRWTRGPLRVNAVLFLCDAVVLSALIRFDERLASMHAAGLECADGAVALAGDSTAGKTTTLLACARAGIPIYSDERVLVRDGVVHPFLRRCLVRADSARRLLQFRDDDALGRMLLRDEDISLARCFGVEAIARPRPLRRLLILDGLGPRTRIRRADSVAALRAISAWFDTAGNGLARLARARELLRNVQSYHIVLGSPHDAARTIADFLHETHDAAAAL